MRFTVEAAQICFGKIQTGGGGQDGFVFKNEMQISFEQKGIFL